MHRIVDAARTSIAESASQLRDAAARQDHEALAFLAHRLKGTSGHLMAHRMHELSFQAEAAAKNRSEYAMVLAEQLADAVDDVNCALLEYGHDP